MAEWDAAVWPGACPAPMTGAVQAAPGCSALSLLQQGSVCGVQPGAGGSTAGMGKEPLLEEQTLAEQKGSLAARKPHLSSFTTDLLLMIVSGQLWWSA